MSGSISEYDLVRVSSVNTAQPWPKLEGMKPPQVGDEGTVVAVLSQRRFIVESVDSEGLTRWLCEFDADDLTVVRQADRGSN